MTSCKKTIGKRCIDNSLNQTYGLIYKKTKSYWSLWEISLLFIFSISTIRFPHCFVLIVTKFLFIRLVEVIEHRHSSWNLNDLICSDLFWSEKSHKSLYPSSFQISLLSDRSKCHTTPRESDLLRLASHPFCCAQALHKLEAFSLLILLRFELFVIQNTKLIRKTLICYGMTLVQTNK